MTLNSLKVLNRQVMISLIGNDSIQIRQFEIDFLKQAQVSIKKIATFYQLSDFEQIKEEAHFLKTSARAVGAEQSAMHLQNMESAALKKDKAECKELLKLTTLSLKSVYEEVKNA